MAGQESAARRASTPRARHRDPLTKVNLASVVAALAAVMERTVDEPFLPELRKRAEALAARLR